MTGADDEASDLRKLLHDARTELDATKHVLKETKLELSRYVCEGCGGARENCIPGWKNQRCCCPDCTHKREAGDHAKR